jgi:uncharacterized membrane protein HdeD (DUF308 family)
MAKNRRIGPDAIMNLLSWISILSWVVLAVIFIILVVTKPSGSSTMAAVRSSSGGGWSTSAIYGLLIFLILISVAGIFFNMTRLKRKTDNMRLTPIISGILSIIGLIVLNMK